MQSDPVRRSSIRCRRRGPARWSDRAAMSKRHFITLVAGWSSGVGGLLLMSVLVRAFGWTGLP